MGIKKLDLEILTVRVDIDDSPFRADWYLKAHRLDRDEQRDVVELLE